MPVLPFVYLAVIIVWIIIIFAFMIDDWAIKSLASLFLMIIGIFVMINGIEGITNIAVVGFGIIHTAVGFYVITVESFKEYEFM